MMEKVLTGQYGTGSFLEKQLVIKCAMDTRQRMEYMPYFYRVFCSCRVSLVLGF